MKTVTRSSLAAHLCCDPGTIDAYRIAGVIKRRADGRFDMDECRKRVLEHLRAKAAGRSGHGDADLSKARALLATAQTESAVIKNEIAKGALVHVDLVRKHVEQDHFLVREALLNLPGSLSDDLAEGDADRRAHIESKLTDAIYGVLTHLSNGDSIAARASGKRSDNNNNGNRVRHRGATKFA